MIASDPFSGPVNRIVSNDLAIGVEQLRGRYFFCVWWGKWIFCESSPWSGVWGFIEEDILKQGFGD